MPFVKILYLHNMTIILRSVFQKDSKYYSQIFLDESLYGLSMLEYNKIDISEIIDVKKTNASKNLIFVIIGIF